MATENTKQEDLEVQENDDGSAIVVDPAELTPAEGHAEDEAAPVSGRETAHEDDDGPTEAEELRAAANEAAREAIRARRRKERKDKKAAQMEREQNLRNELVQAKTQLQTLSERLNIMDRKTSGAELAQLDQAIRQGQGAVEHYTGLLAQAASTNNGAGQAEAIRNLMLANERVKELSSIRQRTANPAPSAPALDPVMVTHAQNWMSQNSWYNPQGSDDDSRVVLGLDAGLVRDGYQPNTPGYWQELDKRVAKYMPHRRAAAGGGSAQGGGGENSATIGAGKPGRSVVTGSGRDAANSGRNTTGYALSAERVKALKDAGMWEDPAQRNAMIKEFREYDRKAASESR